MRAADQRAGAASILIGAAANKSIASDKAVDVASLVRNMGYPDYPAMPSRDAPLSMPPKAAEIQRAR